MSPTVVTKVVDHVSANTAQCGGEITFDGGASITERGVCWSTSPNPTTANDHSSDGNGYGSFVSTLTGLNAHTTYYLRAYATNSIGTSYGEERQFMTLSN